MKRMFALTGHVWAFCAVGWALIAHMTAMPLYWVVSGLCALVAVRSWVRMREFDE